MKYSKLMEALSHKDRTKQVNGWEVVTSHHGHNHEERGHSELPGGHDDFAGKVIKKIEGLKNPSSGEYLYHSMKHNRGALLNVDHVKKQLRVMTILPHGRSVPRPGTRKVMIEGVEQDVECVVLYDTEFDEAFDQFVTEELGMSLDDVLTESDGRATYALDEETKVKFKSFDKQKRVTGSINPQALFRVTSTDGDWLKLENRFEVHHSEVTPHKKSSN